MKKVALVLGGSEGIGFACAKKLLEEGNRVCMVSRNIGNLESALDRIDPPYKENALIYPQDIGNSDAISNISEFMESQVGLPDILVNCNGGPKPGKILSLTDEDWEQAFNTFAMPVIRSVRHFSRAMIEKKWGRIITIGSIAAREPIENLDLSNFIRSGFLGLHKSLSRDVAKHNVNVHLLHPGSIYTSRTQQRIKMRAEDLSISYEDSVKISQDRIPMGKIGSPDDVGKLAAFLCSDSAAYLTGTTINVDGGMSVSI